MITVIPLMAVAFIAYNGIVFGLGGVAQLGAVVFSLNMMSGAQWTMTLGDLMIAAGLFLLFLEILKSTRIGKLSILDHLLSTVVLIVFLVEFLLVPSAATSVFFLLMMMALIDVMAGFSVSIRAASRDVNFGEGSL